MVRNTDNGKKIKEDIEGLKMLLRAYRSGDFDVQRVETQIGTDGNID